MSKEEIKLSETAEGALRANVEGILQDLAEGTGGFHISNTNNFKPGAEKIAADIAGYYELTYTPPPFAFDGSFRPIEVRVARKDVTVHTRNGYFALPPGEASAVFPYEVPLLGALSVESRPHDFQLRAGALRFGDAADGRARHQDRGRGADRRPGDDHRRAGRAGTASTSPSSPR